jgi:predicted membrane channel-forming protein YqfA (hemolysin III family)
MEKSQVLYLTVVIFVFATMIGVLMITMQLQKELVPKKIMYAHSALAATAFLILMGYSIKHPEDYPRTSVILFVLAGLLGIYMFTNFMKERNNPMVVDILYGCLALGGFVTLLMYIF